MGLSNPIQFMFYFFTQEKKIPIRIILSVLSTLFLINHSLFSADIEFNTRDVAYYVNDKVRTLETDSASSFETIVNHIDAFKTADKGKKNFGYCEGALWVNFSVKNQSELKTFLQIKFPTLDKVSLFKYNDQKKLIWTKINYEWEFEKNREINHQFYHFDLDLSKAEEANYLLCIEAKEQIVIPIKIGSERAIFSTILEQHTMLYLFLGIMITLFVYNGFVYVIVKDKDYLFYLLYIFLMTMSQINKDGFTTMYLWPDIPFAPNFAISQLAVLSGVSAMLFSLRFLNPNWKNKFTAFSVGLFVSGWIIGLSLGWFGEYTLSRQFTLPSTLFGAFMLIFVAVQNLRNNINAASTKFFLVVWSFYMVFIMYFIASIAGVFPYTDFTDISPEIGAALEGVLLSFALANRINIMTKEKLTSQKLAFDSQSKYQQLLSSQKKELEVEVSRRTEELKEANLELQRQALSAQINPHFVFNVLNSIQAYILKSERLEAYKYLSKFSKLMRFFLSSSLHKTVELEQEIRAVNHYLELEKIRFGDKISFNIDTDIPYHTEMVKIPSMLILPFLENSVWHGLAPLEKGGHLSVHFFMQGESLRCKIVDNGLGYKHDKKESRKNHESVGMNITKERMQLHAKKIGQEYYFKITDQAIDLNKGRGTIVEFNLPYEYMGSSK